MIKPFLFCLCLTIFLMGCGKEIYYEDDFSSADSRWLLESDDLGYGKIENGTLQIQINTAKKMQYVTFVDKQKEAVEIEVDATITAGSIGSSYGVLFRMENGTRFYRFSINGQGAYTIQKYNDGVWVQLHTGGETWMYSDAIKTGINETNQLRVEIKNSIAVFAVNGKLLERIESFDSSYPTGWIGLEAGTFVGSSTTVAFDNLVIREP